MALSQDQAKILSQILNSLHFLPKEAKEIISILDELDKLIIDKTLDVPTVIVIPENINIKIERVKK